MFQQKKVRPLLPGGHFPKQMSLNIHTLSLFRPDTKMSSIVTKAKTFIESRKITLQICLIMRQVTEQINVCPRLYKEMNLTP